MTTISQNTFEYFKSLKIIHLALIAGQVFFGFVTVYLHNSGQFSADGRTLDGIFQILVPIFAFSGITISLYIFRNKVNQIKEKTTLKEKFEAYRKALVIKYALLEAPSFFALVCYLLTANVTFLYISLIIIAVFILNKPSKKRAITELELSENETISLDDPNCIVAEFQKR